MIKLLGLRTAIYRVSDLEAAKKWYAEVLEFGPYFDEPFYVGFEVGGYELGLQPLEGVEGGHSGGVQVYWGVEDAQAAFDLLLGLGATPYEPPTEVGGGIVVAMVKDPWDNAFGVIYNPHFKVSG